MKLTPKEKEVVLKIREGWICESRYAWNDKHEIIPMDLCVRTGEYPNEQKGIPIHGRVANSLVKKGVIKVSRQDFPYFIEWKLTDEKV